MHSSRFLGGFGSSPVGARGEQSVWEAPHARRVKAGTTRDWGKKGI